VGLLDADVFGPSIPLMMNISDVPETNHQNLIIPVKNYNVKCMSMGLLVDEESPVSYTFKSFIEIPNVLGI
jgi:ATP-binding protein involved in chromosome partitioning